MNVSELELTLEKSSRPDLIFINKHGPTIYDALYTSLQMESNTPDNIEAVYTTLALLCVELASAETVIDLLQLLLGLVVVWKAIIKKGLLIILLQNSMSSS